RGTRRHQARMNLDVDAFQPIDERGIETSQALAVVKIGEAEVMPELGAQRRRGHWRNIRMGRGVIRLCANRLNKEGHERKAACRATLLPDDGAHGFTHGPAPMQTVPVSVRTWLIVLAAMI